MVDMHNIIMLKFRSNIRECLACICCECSSNTVVSSSSTDDNITAVQTKHRYST